MTALVAGEPIRESWWAHPLGNVIYNALGGSCLQIAGAQYHLVKAIQPGGGIADVSLRRRADFTVSGQFPALAVAYPEQKSRPVIGREGGSQLG